MTTPRRELLAQKLVKAREEILAMADEILVALGLSE
jgi:hypothetical protein